MADYIDDRGGVILDGPFDPDAQATVTDYIDYTEYLPADLIRSLTLVHGLDERYLKAAQTVHELTQTYGKLPELRADERPSAQELRKNISQQLDRAMNARESSFAEACRLYDVVDRHFDRLDCIRQKLHALPKPAIPESSPPPAAIGSKRTRGEKAGAASRAPARLTLRLDRQRAPARKGGGRRSTIGGRRLGRLHPDSPIASTEHSDAEGDPKLARSAAQSIGKTNLKVANTARKDKQTHRAPASLPGPRLHRSVAHISTSSALALLKPPPEDAKPGSEDLPWLRLTEWEMTMLRKKMKKNAVWQPSEVMIHRELALRGRGWEAYTAAKAEAEKTGAEFLDCDNVLNTQLPANVTQTMDSAKGDVAIPSEITTLGSNRGMKMTKAKKLQRETLAREQAAAEAELDDGNYTLLESEAAYPSQGNVSQSTGRISRKRKLDETVNDTARALEANGSTLRGLNKRWTKGSIPSPTGFATQATRASKRATATPTPPLTGPPSRRRSLATSGEPSGIAAALALGGRGLRPRSATPARRTPAADTLRPSSSGGATAAAQRRKRPAPGIVQSGLDGGASISHGRRKAKPAKKKVTGARETVVKDNALAVSQDIRIDEDGMLEEIDPNEPRYCLCGDVSFGTMICCENPDCDKEWFHLDCVGLTDVPSRTAKWYCPQCRVQFHKGSDGILKAGSRR